MWWKETTRMKLKLFSLAFEMVCVAATASTSSPGSCLSPVVPGPLKVLPLVDTSEPSHTLFPLPRRPLTSSGLPGKLEILPFKPAQMSPPGGVSGLLQSCRTGHPHPSAKLLPGEPPAGCDAALTACESSCTAGVPGLGVGGGGPGMAGLPPLSQRPRVPWEGGGYNDGGHDLSSQDTCIPIPAPQLTGRVTLRKSLKFPAPQFPRAK